MTWWLWLGLAGAQDAASEEIVVIGEAVQRARAAVLRELTALGYDRVKERDGVVILKHGSTWKGKVLLHDDGYLEHRRQGFRLVEGPAKTLPKGTRWLPCVLIPTGCVQSGLGVSRRKLDAQKDRTLTAVEPQLRDLADRLADAALAETLELLPAQLDAVWTQGVPLAGGEPLPTYRARRAEILEFWSTRTDTEWGHHVQDTVGAYVRNVIQVSDHPYPWGFPPPGAPSDAK